MKRMNVIVDDELLEKARKVSGERTYSGAINKALAEYVRHHDFRAALRKLQELASPDAVYPGYLEEIRPNAYGSKRKQKISAHERRVK